MGNMPYMHVQVKADAKNAPVFTQIQECTANHFYVRPIFGTAVAKLICSRYI